jgi:hypothetical protein
MDFDPYETWLGIPADRQPPTYYDLLGLAPDESDPAAIDRAALRRMGKVRLHQFGPHSELSQEMLTELARARLVLMDPDRRTDYDAKLRAHSNRRRSPSSLAPENLEIGDAPKHRPGPDEDAPDLLGSLVLTEQEGNAPLTLRTNPKKASSSSNRGRAFVTFLVIDAVLLGAVFYFLIAPARQDPPAPPAIEQPKTPALLTRPGGEKKPDLRPPMLAQRPAGASGGTRVMGSERANASSRGDRRQSKSTDQADDEVEQSAPTNKPAPNLPNADRAAQVSPEQRLKDLGLKREGSLYVLERESLVRQKYQEARSRSDEYLGSQRLKEKGEEFLETAALLRQEDNDLTFEIATLNLDLRYRPPRPNNIQAEYYNGVQNERDWCERRRNVVRLKLGQIQSMQINPARLNAEVQRRHKSCVEIVGELLELIDWTNTIYDRLAKNDQVKAALDELARKSKVQPLKVAPSADYLDKVNKIKQFDKGLKPAP